MQKEPTHLSTCAHGRRPTGNFVFQLPASIRNINRGPRGFPTPPPQAITSTDKSDVRVYSCISASCNHAHDPGAGVCVSAPVNGGDTGPRYPRRRPRGPGAPSPARPTEAGARAGEPQGGRSPPKRRWRLCGCNPVILITGRDPRSSEARAAAASARRGGGAAAAVSGHF